MYRLNINYFTDFRLNYIPITISGLILLSLLTKWTIFTPESACPPAPSSMSKSIPSQPYLEFIHQTWWNFKYLNLHITRYNILVWPCSNLNSHCFSSLFRSQPMPGIIISAVLNTSNCKNNHGVLRHCTFSISSTTSR